MTERYWLDEDVPESRPQTLAEAKAEMDETIAWADAELAKAQARVDAAPSWKLYLELMPHAEWQHRVIVEEAGSKYQRALRDHQLVAEQNQTVGK